MSNSFIPCQHCGKTLPQDWRWFVCNQCGFRVCRNCLGEHHSQHGRGFKCSRCSFGQMKEAK